MSRPLCGQVQVMLSTATWKTTSTVPATATQACATCTAQYKSSQLCYRKRNFLHLHTLRTNHYIPTQPLHKIHQSSSSPLHPLSHLLSLRVGEILCMADATLGSQLLVTAIDKQWRLQTFGAILLAHSPSTSAIAFQWQIVFAEYGACFSRRLMDDGC